MAANISIYAGAPDREGRFARNFGVVSVSGKRQEEKEGQTQGFLLNGQIDPIEQRKEIAKKQAYQIVKDALANELEMDEEMQKLEDEVDGLWEDLAQAKDKTSRILIEKEIMANNAVVRGMKQERLKKDFIREAQRQKDDALGAASEEAIGMLVDEAKEKIDEKSEEAKEKAEERAREEKARQEKLDAAKEHRKEMEEVTNSEKAAGDNAADAQAEAVSDDAQAETMAQLDAQKADYQREIEEMMKKMKLLMEDIKGIKVDGAF